MSDLDLAPLSSNRGRRRKSGRPRLDRFAYRPGNGLGLVERLECRQLLSSDLTTNIANLINQGDLSGTYAFSDVTVGSFVSIPSVSITLNLSMPNPSEWNGTVSVDATSASVNLDSAVTGSITTSDATDALTGTYTLTDSASPSSGKYSLTAQDLKLSVGSAFSAEATPVSLSYDPNAGPGQTLATIGSATATFQPLNGATATISNLTVFEDGFTLGNATVATDGSINLGGILSATSPLVSFTNVVDAGGTLAGTVSVSAASASILAGSSGLAAGGNGLNLTGFSGSYTLPDDSVSIAATGADLKVGKLVDATATGVTLGYNPAASSPVTVSVQTLTATSPLFPDVKGSITNLQASSTGLSFADATLSDSGTISLENVFQVTGLSISLDGFDYSTDGGTQAGSASLSMTGATLFSGQSFFNASVTDFAGSYTFSNGALALRAGDINLSFGQALKVDATNVAVNWDGTTASFKLDSATLNSPEFPNFTGTLGAVNVTSTGFAIGSASFTDTDKITLGSVITLVGPTTVTATNLDYTNGSTPQDSSLSGTIGLSFGGLDVLPDSTAFSTTVTGFSGTYDLTSQETTLTVGSIVIAVGSGSSGSSTANPVLTVTANAVDIDLTPEAGGMDDSVLIKVGSATAALNEFSGVYGSITNLAITSDGFSVGSATLGVGGAGGMGTVSAFGNSFKIANPSATLTSFGYSNSTKAFTAGSLSLAATEVDLNQGGSASVVATGLTTTISFAPGDVGHTIITAGSLAISLGKYVSVSGSNITIDTAASNGYYAEFASLTGTVAAGSLSLTGTATDFAIDANGHLVPGNLTDPKTGKSIPFGVDFSTNAMSNSSTATNLKWPSWMPITISTLGVSWPNGFATAPTDVDLTLSATIGASFANNAFQIGGSVTNAVFDLSLFGTSKLPLVSLDSASLTVGGKLGGAQISGTAFVGITDGIFYGGIEGSLMIGGSGITIWVGLSQDGPLDLFVDSEIPITLDPTTGLAIQSIRGGVEFDTSLTSPGTAKNLATSNAYQPPAMQTTATWEQGLTNAVDNQATAVAGGYSVFDQPFVIEAGITLYDEYATANAFTLAGDVEIDTTGKLLATGTLTVGGATSPLKLQAGAYLDLSMVSQGVASLLWYLKAPAATPILSVYGSVTITVTNPSTPAATIDIAIVGEADLAVPGIQGGIDLMGTADFLMTPASKSLDLTVSGTASLQPLGQFGSLAGHVYLAFNGSTPQLYGVLYVNVNTANIPTFSTLGLNINATGFVEFNTTSTVQNVSLTPPGATVATPYAIEPYSAILDIPKTTLTYTPPKTTTSVLEIDAALYASFALVALPGGGFDPELDIAFSGSAEIGPAPNSLGVTASGILIINSDGLAANFTVTASAGNAIPGVAIDASLMLTLNTTGTNQSFTVPNIADPANPGSYLAGSGQTYAIAGSYPLSSTTMTSGFYLVVIGSGNVDIENDFTLGGSFDILVTSSVFRIDVTQMTLSVPSLGGLSLTASGGLLIDSSGIAGAIMVSAGAGMSGPGGVYSLNGTFLLEVNTTKDPVTIGGVGGVGGIMVPQYSALVSIAGDLDIANGVVDLRGNFLLSVSPAGLTIGGHFTASVMNATLSSGTLDAELYKDANGNPELALYAALTLSGSFGSGFLSFSANPSLEINTGPSTQTFTDGNVAPAQSATLELTNSHVTVLGFQASGTLIVAISNSGFDISIPQSDPLSLSFLGLGGMQIYGYIDDDNGNFSFSVTGSIGFDVTVGPFEVYGGIGATIASTGFSAWFYGGAKLDCGALGTVDLASISALITVMTDHIEIAASADVLGLSFSFDYNLGGYTPPAHMPGLFSYSVPTSAAAGSVPTLSAVVYSPAPGNNLLPADGYHDEWDITSPATAANGNVAYSQTSTSSTFSPQLTYAGTYTVSLYEDGPNGYRTLLKQTNINVIVIAPVINSLNLEPSYLTTDSSNGSGSTGPGSTTITLSPRVTTTNEAELEPAGYNPYAPPASQTYAPTSGSYWDINLNGVNTYYPGLYPNNVVLAPVSSLATTAPVYTATLVVRDPYNLPGGGTVQQTSTFNLLDIYNLTVNDARDEEDTGSAINGGLDLEPINGELTLRRAIDIINDNATDYDQQPGRVATIHFAPSLAGQTIYLDHEEFFDASDIGSTDLGIEYPTIIDGSAAPGLIITNAADNHRRLFFVGPYSLSGTVTFKDLTLQGGSANGEGAAAYGGAIYVETGASVFADHVAYLNNSANATYTNNDKVQNADGGAVFIDLGGMFVAQECTFSGNSANGSFVDPYAPAAGRGDGFGGAIYNLGGTLGIQGTTIAANSVTGNTGSAGAGVYIFSSFARYDGIFNTIIADNTGANGLDLDDLDNLGTSSDIDSHSTGNLIFASQGLFPPGMLGITGKNPNLGMLLQRGDLDLWTYSLKSNSPAIATGSFDFNDDATDGRGQARTVNGQVDIGSFERQSYIVDSNQGSGPGTLPLAITTDDDGSTITFAANVTGISTDSTIYNPTTGISYTTYIGQMEITRSLTIAGPGAGLLTINGDNLTQLFKVDPGIVVTISGLTLAGGMAVDKGGAIDNYGNLTLTNDLITGNTVNGDSAPSEGDGGAIYNEPNSSLTIDGDTFVGNQAIGGKLPNYPNLANLGAGGAIYSASGTTLTGNDDTFSGNVAQGGSVTLYGVTYYSQGYGGAIVSGGSTSLTNVTLADNSALSGVLGSYNIPTNTDGLPASNGADIWVNGGTLTLTNSIVADPVAGVDVYAYSGSVTGSNNLIMSSVNVPSGVILTTADPQLRALGNYGGTTPTLELVDGSPALNVALASALPATDQRGIATQGDLGAFQLRHGFIVTNTNDSGAGSLRQTLIDDTDETTITFASNLARQTITLTSGTILLAHDIQIDGSAAPGLTIDGHGGQIFLIGSAANVIIDDLTLTNGRANLGGAIQNNGQLTLINDTLSKNIAQGDTTPGLAGLGAGGAIYNAPGSTLTATGSTFLSNIAMGAPGVLAPGDGRNSGDGGQGHGGAIDNEGNAKLILTDDTFSNNQAFGGNALYSNGYLGNGGPGYAGGLVNYGTAVLTNDTFSGDGTRGGLGVSGGYNEAADVLNSGALVITNTILANSTGGTDLYNNGTSVKGSNNLAMTSSGIPAGVVASTASPQLLSLASNGGLTQTFTLGSNSPALGAGLTTSVPATDQRGLARVVGGAVDLGSYETQLIPAVVAIGGPYVGYFGQSVTLSASGTSNPSGSNLKYNWTVSGNGFTRALLGVSPALALVGLPIGSYTVSLTVSDGYAGNHTVSAQTSLTLMPGLTVTSVTPAILTSSVNSTFDTTNVTFAYPINGSSFYGNAIQVNLNGALAPLPVSLTVSPVGDPLTTTTYQISGLAALMAKYGQGTYKLSINAAYVQGAAMGLGYGTGTHSASWIYDTSAPTSHVLPLPTVATNSSFIVTVTGSDAAGPGVTASGVASYDIEVSVDGGPFTFWTNVASSSPSATYTGVGGATYAFQSFARDAAGNLESKPATIESSTYVPITQAPGIHVTAVNVSSQQFVLTLGGSAASGGVLDHIDVYVSIDAKAFRPIAKVAGTNSTVTFAAIADGTVHQYAFYAVGTDTAGNVQIAPPGPVFDERASASFAAPSSNVPIALTVDHGAKGRSFVGSVDLAFDNSVGLASLISGGQVHLIKHNLDGTGSTPVSVAGLLSAVDNLIEFNFGALGLGGGPDTTAGDGYYEIDIDGIAQSFFFDRLFGDVAGDGIVDATDASLTTSALGLKVPGALINLDGTGAVSPLTRLTALRSQGRQLSSGLHLDA